MISADLYCYYIHCLLIKYGTITFLFVVCPNCRQDQNCYSTLRYNSPSHPRNYENLVIPLHLSPIHAEHRVKNIFQIYQQHFSRIPLFSSYSIWSTQWTVIGLLRLESLKEWFAWKFKTWLLTYPLGSFLKSIYDSTIFQFYFQFSTINSC